MSQKMENTRFFHGTIRGRLKKNTLHGLNINGSWVEDPVAVKKETLHSFAKQFNETMVDRPEFLSNNFKSLPSHQVAFLE